MSALAQPTLGRQASSACASTTRASATPRCTCSDQSREGKSNQSSAIVLSLLVTPLFLLMHGKDATIPEGQAIIRFVDDDADGALPVSPPVED